MSFFVSHMSSSPDEEEEDDEEEEQDEEEDVQGLAEAEDVALHVPDMLPLLMGPHSFPPWMQQSHFTWFFSFGVHYLMSFLCP